MAEILEKYNKIYDELDYFSTDAKGQYMENIKNISEFSCNNSGGYEEDSLKKGYINSIDKIDDSQFIESSPKEIHEKNQNINTNEVIYKVNGKIITNNITSNKKMSYAFASDLMSDVLTLTSKIDEIVLITGLCTPQTIRTANVAYIQTVILARNKKATSEMISLAKEYNICLIESPYSIFKCCIALHEVGLKPLY